MNDIDIKALIKFFNPAGHVFIALFAAVTLVFAFIGWPLFLTGLVLTAWCAYFFRDPARVTPTRAGLIVSPADGRVIKIDEVTPVSDLGLGDEPRMRISIFLNVFDVHVNRMPTEGKVVGRYYRKGTFINASFDKASEDNERMALVVEMTGNHSRAGQTIGCVQIAGLIARRIVCEANEGSTYRAGERYGIIRFGSRAEIYLPRGMQPMVCVGQYMIGGESVIADCASGEAARLGETR